MALKKLTIDLLIDEDITTEFVMDSIEYGLENRKFIHSNNYEYIFNKLDAVYYPETDKWVCPIQHELVNLNEQNTEQERK